MKCPSPSPGSGVAAAPPLRGPGSVGSWKSRAARAERSPRRARLAASRVFVPRLLRPPRGEGKARWRRWPAGPWECGGPRTRPTQGDGGGGGGERGASPGVASRACERNRPRLPFFHLRASSRGGQSRREKGAPRGPPATRTPLCPPLLFEGGCLTLGGSLPVSPPPRPPFPPWVELGLFKSTRFVCFWLRLA